jgi:hypothetical protein
MAVRFEDARDAIGVLPGCGAGKANAVRNARALRALLGE